MAWLAVAVVGFCAVLILIGAIEEPYHIDELRQVSSYARSPQQIVEANLSQQQPPLDALLNAAVQRVLGVGDVNQRAVSMAAATMALGLLGWLCLRRGLGVGAVVTVALVGLSPLFIQLVAYARPYALPLVLMLTFVAAAEVALSSGKRAALAVMFVAALLLPLSRTTEPTMFLAAVGVLFAMRGLPGGAARKRVAAVALAASIGVVAVGLPVYLAVRARADAYVASDSVGMGERLARIPTEVPAAIADVVPLWPMMLVLVLASVVVPHSRRWLFANWWWWALVATPLIFVVAFFVTTPPSSTYYDRYVFFWLPPAAVAVGALVSAAQEGIRGGRVGLVRLPVALGVAVLLVTQAGSVALALTHQENPDFARASEIIVGATPPDAEILYDRVVPFGLYRGAFYGQRYLQNRRAVFAVQALIGAPATKLDGPVAVLLSRGSATTVTSVPGWRRIPIDPYLDLYVAPRGTATDVVGAQQAFARALGPDVGAAMQLAAAAQLYREGDVQAARRLVAETLAAASPPVVEAAKAELRAAGLFDAHP